MKVVPEAKVEVPIASCVPLVMKDADEVRFEVEDQ